MRDNMHEEKLKIQKELRTLLQSAEAQYAFHYATPIQKDYQLSCEVRAKGNDLYLHGKHDGPVHEKILSLYNKSIAFAPKDSEVQAAAYANKSALLLHFHKYSESICEIDKALKMTSSCALKIKLLCRKAECLTGLNSSENMKNLEKAKFIITKLDKESEKVEDILKKLIQKTETMIASNPLEPPKKDKKKAQKLKMITDAKQMDTSGSVEVKSSKKFGVHLVAAQDFKPGEILIVEKPYCKVINATNHASYLRCGHCSQYLWTSVPCDHCTWCMFCSEQCKNQAWEEYHDIECQVMSSILRAGLIIAYPYAQLSLRIFLKSLREAGGVNQLAFDLQSILKSSDQNETNSSDIKLEGYKYVYSLLGNATQDEDEDITRASALTLITLAKYSSIFGSKIESNDIKEFFKNDDAIFVGALLLKICRVTVLNNSISFLKNLDCTSSPEQKLNGQCRAQCCGNHAFIAPKISSIAISCTPNVGRCATSDNTVIIFALKPIEKGEQLVNSIYSIYKPAPLPVRQRVYKKRYGSACCCQTCVKNWTEESLTQNVPEESATQVDRMMDEMISITKRVGPKDDNDVELLHKTKECLEVFWKHLKLPSLYLVCAVKYLTHFFTSVYGERSTIPDSCKP